MGAWGGEEGAMPALHRGSYLGRGRRRGAGGRPEGTNTRTAEEARHEGHIRRPAD